MKLEDTELPRRVCTDLRNAGITTVGELCQYRWIDLLRKPRIGRGSLDNIETMLAGIGKKLKEGKPSRKLEDTELPRRDWAKLYRMEIRTVDDLCQYSRYDLLAKSVDPENLRDKGLGTVSLQRIETMLRAMGKLPKDWHSIRSRND